MRTEPMRARTLRLAALLLTGYAAPLAAQQEPPQPPAAPAAQAAPAPPAPPQAAGSKRVFTADHTVQAGETVEDVVVVGGDLQVRGEVTGDAVVVGGNLLMEKGGQVLGDAVVTGGEIVQNGGVVRGEMRMVDGEGVGIANEIRREMVEARAGHEAVRHERHVSEFRPERSWFDSIRHGFAGLISTIALAMVLAGAGAALIFYGRPYLETVSDTVRTNTLRSGAVGLAAGFLAIPAFVVLVVALAVTIIGIPVLILAVPFYWIALFAAAVMGLLSVTHAVGERTAEQNSQGWDFRYRNSYSYLITGIGLTLSPLVASWLLEIAGLGFLAGAVLGISVFALVVATMFGLGAVILSRAGTRRTFVVAPPEALYDTDPLFDADGAERGPHA